MNIPETFYVALATTILLLAALYWVWTQLQYAHTKLSVLETIVYELKAATPDHGGGSSQQHEAHPNYAPPPSSVLGDDDDDDLLEEHLAEEAGTIEDDFDCAVGGPADEAEGAEAAEGAERAEAEDAEAAEAAEPAETVAAEAGHQSSSSSGSAMALPLPQEEEASALLQPGGSLLASGRATASFSSPFRAGSSSSSSITDPLQALTLKELRRLAEQRGVPGAPELKKKELLAALRTWPAPNVLSSLVQAAAAAAAEAEAEAAAEATTSALEENAVPQ